LFQKNIFFSHQSFHIIYFLFFPFSKKKGKENEMDKKIKLQIDIKHTN